MDDSQRAWKPDVFRSVLFVPANSPRFIASAPSSGADVICLDLEDSVPSDEKDGACEAAAKAIDSLAGGRAQVWVRVNSLDSGLINDDLRAIVRPGLRAVVLPKPSCAEDVVELHAALGQYEAANDLWGVGIVPLIESARAVRNCYQIVEASGRVVAGAFGSEDFCADLGVRRSPEVLQFPRAKLAIACAASGVVAIDTVETEYRDEAHVEREAMAARDMGFSAKLCIHPAQVRIVNRVFSPTPEELEAARLVIDAFEREGLAKGRAAIAIDGKMVDTPHYERAKRLLELVDKGNR